MVIVSGKWVALSFDVVSVRANGGQSHLLSLTHVIGVSVGVHAVSMSVAMTSGCIPAP